MKAVVGLILVLSLMLFLWGCEGRTSPTVLTSEIPEATEAKADTAVVQGTILEITDTALTLQTEAGKQTFSLTERTLYYRDFGRGGFPPGPVMPNEGQQPPENGQQPPELPVDGQKPPMNDGYPPEPPTDGQQPVPPAVEEETTEEEGFDPGGFTPGNGDQGSSAPSAGYGQDGSFDPGSRPGLMEPQTITREVLVVGDTVSLTLDEQGAVLALTVEGRQPPEPRGAEGATGQ